MFNGNNKISSSQIYKGLFCAIISNSMLLLLYNYNNALDAVLTITMTFIFSFLFCIVIGYFFRKKEWFSPYYRSKLGIIKKTIIGILAFFTIIKYIIVMSLALYFIYFTINYALRMNIKNFLIPVFLFILCLYISKNGIEKLFRFSEILFYIILLPVIILILTTVTKVSPAILMVPSTNSSIIYTTLKSLLFAIILFPVEIISPLKEYSNPILYVRKTIFPALLTGFVFMLIFCIITIGIFGTVSTDYTIHPLFSLMQMSSLNSKLGGRLDGIVCIFIFSGLIYSISFYLYFCSEAIRLIIPKYKKRIFVIPLLIVFTITLLMLPDGYTGAYTKSPEERAIVRNIIVSNDNNIYFEIYNSSEDNIIYDTHSSTLSDAEKYFRENESFVLDFSHTQAIFVPEATFKDTEKLKALLENYKKDLRFPETMEIHDADTPANSKKIYSIFLNQ